jgi:hypothetical protein
MRNLALLVVLGLALAGCGDSSKGKVDEELFDGLELREREDKGILRGVALTPALVPIPNVAIRLTGPDGNVSTATTGASGEFGFDLLDPGAYVVEGTKAGFVATQRPVVVKAGDAGDALRLVMAEDPSTRPYAMTQSWEGYIECSVREPGLVVGGYNLCNHLPGEASEQDTFYHMTFETLPTYVHAEMVWDSTQELGDQLTLVVGPPDCRDVKYGRSDGESPRPLGLNATTLAAEDVTTGDEGGLCYRVFTWYSDQAAGMAGATLQQKFTVYFVQFYNFEPPAGYLFSEMGEPVPPV